MRRRLFHILNGDATAGKIARIVSSSLALLIALNVLSVIIETIAAIGDEYDVAFYRFEVFSVLVFTVEYTLRIWCCVENDEYKNPFWGRFRFALTPLALVDLLAILPFYLPWLIHVDMRMLRALRLIRMLRILKMGRYSSALTILRKVVARKKEELAITTFMVSVLLVIASSLMYYLERDAQPETFSSIPQAIWWGIATLTTVGYGDVYPITPMGKLIGAVIALLSIGIFALPTGIIGSGFIEEMQQRKDESAYCPHCGKKL